MIVETQETQSQSTMILRENISKAGATGVILASCLGIWLGGATRPEEQGILLSVCAAVMFLRLPSDSLRWPEILAALVLGISVAASFAPADTFGEWGWRAALVRDYGMDLKPFLTPQSACSLEQAALLLAGLFWLCHLIAAPAGDKYREWAARAYCFVVAALAAAAIVRHFAPFQMPFWSGKGGLGVFPNRNHFSNVLALAAILNLASLYTGFRAGRKIGYFHLVAMLPIVAALVLNFSRAGLLLFFVGALVWVAWVSFHSKSARRLGVAAALVLMMGSLFFLFGGETLKRFQNGGGAEFTDDFRWKVARDTWAMIQDSPWPGAGLGNFEYVFPHYREESVSQSRVIHPENDWLWLTAEAGLPGGLACLAGVVLLLARACPIRHDRYFSIRSAAFVGAVFFLLHGFADVSGHRMGSLLPAMFMLWIALPEPVPSGSRLFSAQKIASLFFALLVGIVGVMFWGGFGVAEARVQWEQADRDAERAQATGDRALLEKSLDSGLEITPLRWQLYYQRAALRVGEKREHANAARDFARVRFLQPNLVELGWNEGFFWWRAGEADRALAAWNEMFNIPGSWKQSTHTQLPGESPEAIFKEMLNWPKLKKLLPRLAENRPNLMVLCLENATSEEWDMLFGAVLRQDPKLEKFSDPEKSRIFAHWSAKGDRDELVGALLENPAWQASGAGHLAAHEAAQGNFERAVRLVRAGLRPPRLPDDVVDASVSSMEWQFNQSPQDLYKGLRLLHAQIRLKNETGALKTIGRIKQIPNFPQHITVWEADILIGQGEWKKAWAALNGER